VLPVTHRQGYDGTADERVGRREYAAERTAPTRGLGLRVGARGGGKKICEWSDHGATRESIAMMYGRGYGYGYGNMMGGYGWVGLVIGILFLAVIAAGVVLLVLWAVRASSRHASSTGPAPSPGAAGHEEAVAIAKRRLAAGEITAAQFEEIMRALGE
jgi:uncharacterized membrane protein